MGQIVHAPIPLQLGARKVAQFVAGGRGFWELVRCAQNGAVEGEDLLAEEEGGEGERRVGTTWTRGGVIANVETGEAHIYVGVDGMIGITVS